MLLDYTKMNNRGCFNSSIIPLGFCLTSLTSHNKSQKCHSTISLKIISIVTHIHHSTRYESHLNPWLNLNMSTCPWFLDIMVDEVSFVNFVTEPIYQLDLLFVFVRILPKIYLLLLRSLRRHTGILSKQKSCLKKIIRYVFRSASCMAIS